jgi:DNA-binding NarL/FixJ family response regulator
LPIRVLIADDQALVRSGFRLIVETRPDLEVVGEVEDGEEAVRLALELEPDVILMDVRMPGVDGIEATRRIVAAGSAARILVLTTFDLDEYVYAAVRAGASGFLLKDVRPGDLVEAIRLVANGSALLGPGVTRRLLERFADEDASGDAAEAVARLTEREREILRLLASGLSNAELAQQLVVSETPVSSVPAPAGPRYSGNPAWSERTAAMRPFARPARSVGDRSRRTCSSSSSTARSHSLSTSRPFAVSAAG